MRSARFFHNLRTFLWIASALALCGVVGLLSWANHIGLPDSWRAGIEREAASQGYFLTLGELRWKPFGGIEAEEIRIFHEAEKIHEISRLRRVVIALDRTKLARGIIRLNRVELADGDLSLPVDPEDPTSAALIIRDATGVIHTGGREKLEIRDMVGKLGGIEIRLNAHLIRAPRGGGPAAEEKRGHERRALIAAIVHELEQWEFPPSGSPRVTGMIEADLGKLDSRRARFRIEIPELRRNGYALREISADCQVTGGLISFQKLRAEDDDGELSGNADYQIDDRDGRFDLRSTIAVLPLANAWFGYQPPPDLAIKGIPEIDMSGSFRIPKDAPFELNTTGHLECDDLILKKIPVAEFKTDFSWQAGTLYLREVSLERPDGSLMGRVMIAPPLVQLQLDSSFPAATYHPLVAGKPLEKVLADITIAPGASETSSAQVSLSGSFSTADKQAWKFVGTARASGHAYRSIPVVEASAHFDLSADELIFDRGAARFDYFSYPLRERFGGPLSGAATFESIRFRKDERLVRLNGVNGEFWPAPVLRMFAPPIADHLESYEFHTTPQITAGGVIDVTPQGRTEITAEFVTGEGVDYLLFGKNVAFAGARGKVQVREQTTRVTEIQLGAFGGAVNAEFTHVPERSFAGNLHWSGASMIELGRTYDFDSRGNGGVDGRVDFTMKPNRLETLSGSGLLLVKDAELFSVPMLGPLSKVVSGVLKKPGASFEGARDAFCTFTIENGVATTRDFYTSTSSMIFTGDGGVDLSQKTIDFTVRMNARGFLKLLTLPLRPFYGLFQFRGTGPLASPEWDNVRFTEPPDAQGERLLAPPRAAVVPEP